MKKSISAKIIADSTDPRGNRIISYILTYPRFIHSELMTHRVFSRNSASSRAIPFEKMVKSILDDPFIPIAWQKKHKGMQGTEYLDPNKKYCLNDFLDTIETLFAKVDGNLYGLKFILKDFGDLKQTLPEWWLTARNLAIKSATFLYAFGVTKQICNRILEPFMWHTVLVTSTEYENFFNLRCPQYYLESEDLYFKSKKDYSKYWVDAFGSNINEVIKEDSILQWLKINKSQAEVHIQMLAEAMWDAKNESISKPLNPGEWHIPFSNKIDSARLLELSDNILTDSKEMESKILINNIIKIATARAARLSYMTFEGKIDYKKDIELHDRLLKSKHMSPFEHCARCMTDEEYYSMIKGKYPIFKDMFNNIYYAETYAKVVKEVVESIKFKGENPETKNIYGWCNNLRGFIPYRYMIENNEKIF